MREKRGGGGKEEKKPLELSWLYNLFHFFVLSAIQAFKIFLP